MPTELNTAYFRRSDRSIRDAIRLERVDRYAHCQCHWSRFTSTGHLCQPVIEAKRWPIKSRRERKSERYLPVVILRFNIRYYIRYSRYSILRLLETEADHDTLRSWPLASVSSLTSKPKNICHCFVTFLNIEIEREVSDRSISPLIPYTVSAVVVEWLAWRSCASSSVGSIPAVNFRTYSRSMAMAMCKTALCGFMEFLGLEKRFFLQPSSKTSNRFVTPSRPTATSISISISTNDQNKQTVTGLLRSLMAQLSVRQTHLIPDEVHRLYHDCGSGAQRPGKQILISTLLSLFASSKGGIYLVIDALDECSENDELFALIKQVRTASSANLLVTSRREQDIYTALRDCRKHQICIPNEIVDADIEVYSMELQTINYFAGPYRPTPMPPFHSPPQEKPVPGFLWRYHRQIQMTVNCTLDEASSGRILFPVDSQGKCTRPGFKVACHLHKAPKGPENVWKMCEKCAQHTFSLKKHIFHTFLSISLTHSNVCIMCFLRLNV